MIGCLDGSQVRVMPPALDEASYVNQHHVHSINMALVAGPDYRFYFVSTRAPGSWHDAWVLRTSHLWESFEEQNRLPFPTACLLADSAYPLRNWLITPVAGQEDNRQVQRFCSAHARPRATIERAIGVFESRFRCLHNGIRQRDMTDASKTIKAWQLFITYV